MLTAEQEAQVRSILEDLVKRHNELAYRAGGSSPEVLEHTMTTLEDWIVYHNLCAEEATQLRDSVHGVILLPQL